MTVRRWELNSHLRGKVKGASRHLIHLRESNVDYWWFGISWQRKQTFDFPDLLGNL